MSTSKQPDENATGTASTTPERIWLCVGAFPKTAHADETCFYLEKAETTRDVAPETLVDGMVNYCSYCWPDGCTL